MEPDRLPLPLLPRHSSCALCDLSAEAQHVGIPTTLYARARNPTDTALLLIGEAPGEYEDDEGTNFVGPSGRKLTAFYFREGLLDEWSDVWVANVCRCRPPANATPTMGQAKACLPYLAFDAHKLRGFYRRLVVLCLGGTAIKAVCPGCSISDHLRHQGVKGRPNLPPDTAVFATYHPAYILDGRDPARESTVRHHLRLVAEYLATGAIRKEKLPTVEIAPWPPPKNRGPLAIDTETYGILRGPLAKGGPCLKCFNKVPQPGKPPCNRCAGENVAQNTYHPSRMIGIDNVSRDDLITCMTISWRDWDHPSKPIHVGFFNPKYDIHVRRFLGWLRWATEQWYQNAPYDLKVIRAQFGRKAVPPYNTTVVDLLHRGFLYDDLMAERNLKAMGLILRVHEYEEDDRPVKMVSDIEHPKNLRYAGADAFVTYRGIEIVDGFADERFHHHPHARMKLAEHTYKWFSDQTWTATLMEEAGVAFDRERLTALHEGLQTQFNSLLQRGQTDYSLRLSGEGSYNDFSDFVQHAVSDLVRVICKRHPEDSPERERLLKVVGLLTTTKEGGYSTDRNNRNMLLGILPRDDAKCRRVAEVLSLASGLSSVKKIITSYTGPLLYGRPRGETWDYDLVPTKKGAKNPFKRVKVAGTQRTLYDTAACLIQDKKEGNWIAYPTIFTTPKGVDESGKGGGVRQFRWSFKDPALQTLPPILKDALTSRYDPGVLHSYDLAQIEWRTAMYLSNDERGLQEIREGTDIHTRSASFLLQMDIGNVDTLTAWIVSREGRLTLLAAPDVDMKRVAEEAYRTNSSDPAFVKVVKKWLRQNCGKSQNFAELYGGSGGVIQATTRLKSGIEVSEERCRLFVTTLAALYPQRHAWREELISQVVRDGALHLPLLGQSRTFGGSEDAIRGQYRPTILDFPVQTTAANLLQCAALQVQKTFLTTRMKSRVVINTHDAFTIDSPAREYLEAKRLSEEALKDNWYLRELERENDGRVFPLEYEQAHTHYRNCNEGDFIQ